jgi:hypothetical protein
MQITPPVITSPKAGVEKKLAKDWEIMEEITMKCPHCKKEIKESDIAKHFASRGGKAGGKIGGKSKSEKKKLSSRLNGMLGGRPKKKTK